MQGVKLQDKNLKRVHPSVHPDCISYLSAAQLKTRGSLRRTSTHPGHSSSRTLIACMVMPLPHFWMTDSKSEALKLDGRHMRFLRLSNVVSGGAMPKKGRPPYSAGSNTAAEPGDREGLQGHDFDVWGRLYACCLHGKCMYGTGTILCSRELLQLRGAKTMGTNFNPRVGRRGMQTRARFLL